MVGKTVEYSATVALTEDERQRVQIYSGRVLELWGNLVDLVDGQTVLSAKFTRETGKTKVSTQIKNPFRLKGLYVDFRVFILNDEATNFRSVCNILNKCFHQKDARDYVRLQKETLTQDTTMMNWHGISCEDLIDLHFNSNLFHNNLEKREKLDNILKDMEVDALNEFVFLHIHRTARSLNNIRLICEPILEGHDSIRLPA